MKPTQEQVIQWAHEAGLHIATDVHWMPIIGLKYIEKVIALAYEAGAAELRRLHEVNAELVEACQLVIRAYNKLQPASSNQGKEPLEIFAIRAALAKAQGENNDHG